ncbi:hypothetical protein [Rheinheimera baltica]|uniref:Uncharacterized protein n=1 Tax=Rheinheimera baltica TaxID=67576 RepID=A0ABT9I2S0_9GAMM|nr:hypothetical protein [Rheinheimera baltica]MDP5137668.1 hypothetical protein [Rheinheimera baltica]MDP5151893.1 hypothetical protein [Rheinheimera baltica]MDP5189814.1 hypothetical protein [Rheinheimera baltica]
MKISVYFLVAIVASWFFFQPATPYVTVVAKMVTDNQRQLGYFWFSNQQIMPLVIGAQYRLQAGDQYYTARLSSVNYQTRMPGKLKLGMTFSNPAVLTQLTAEQRLKIHQLDP